MDAPTLSARKEHRHSDEARLAAGTHGSWWSLRGSGLRHAQQPLMCEDHILLVGGPLLSPPLPPVRAPPRPKARRSQAPTLAAGGDGEEAAGKPLILSPPLPPSICVLPFLFFEEICLLPAAPYFVFLKQTVTIFL